MFDTVPSLTQSLNALAPIEDTFLKSTEVKVPQLLKASASIDTLEVEDVKETDVTAAFLNALAAMLGSPPVMISLNPDLSNTSSGPYEDAVAAESSDIVPDVMVQFAHELESESRAEITLAVDETVIVSVLLSTSYFQDAADVDDDVFPEADSRVAGSVSESVPPDVVAFPLFPSAVESSARTATVPDAM